jgi:hypothetical protein
MNLSKALQLINMLAIMIGWLVLVGGSIYVGIVLIKKVGYYLLLRDIMLENICKVLIFLCIICITVPVVTALLLDLYQLSSEGALIISGRITSWGVIAIFGVRWYWCRLVDKLKTWLNQ